VKAILRRTGETPASEERVIRRGPLLIDISGHEVKYSGRPVQLTATEFRILQFLAGRPGRVTQRDEIIDAALDRESDVFDRTIDVHITSIRRKLREGGDLIETVRGFGYRFKSEASEE